MNRDKEEQERELAEADGMRPDEEEGPEDSEASPPRCEHRPGERETGVEDSEFTMSDQLDEQFPVEEIPIGMDPQDGMPRPMDQTSAEDTRAIPFTYETVLCIEDDREYVELFDDELLGREWKSAGGTRKETDAGTIGVCHPPGLSIKIDVVVSSQFNEDGTERARAKYKPEEVEHLWGVNLIKTAFGYRPVRPIRERCKHYRRQVFSNDAIPDMKAVGHQIIFRVCAARRSNGGSHMSLRDEGIYACDFRDPIDVPTSRLQDAKDKKKLVERPDLVHYPLFNMPGDAVQLERPS